MIIVKNQEILIKIGYQNQADKAIFLHKNGSFECGNLKYQGRYIIKFQNYYSEILGLASTKPKKGVLDVSQVRYWDAISIYDDYVVVRWVASVSAKKLEKFANETSIKIMLSDIELEFRRYCHLRWKNIFKNSDLNDINTPKDPWQIL